MSNLGYPYFYGNENFDENETVLIFFLDEILPNSNSSFKLNSTELVTLPLVLDTLKVEFGGDQFSFDFCDQISSICGTIKMIPESNTIILDYEGFSKIMYHSDLVIDKVSSNLCITKQSALQQAENFFKDKNVIVQVGGAEGVFYKAGSYLQSAGSATLLTRTITLAKLAGVSGIKILNAQPMLIVAIPTTGAMFFYACAAITGNTTIGKVLVTTGDFLALPMKGFELMWNSYGNPVIQRVFGFPLILNMTQTFKTGPGYTILEVQKYIPIEKKVILKKVKQKLISWLSK